MTRKQVLDDFNSGATLSAIIDSWDLGAVNGDTCQVAALPAMNDTLSMRGGSYTELLVVNAFTERKKRRRISRLMLRWRQWEILKRRRGISR